MRKLQRKRGSRKALLKNLATSLILFEKIKTTLEKAKEVRPFVEKLISKGKKGDLAARRYLLKFLPKNAVLKIIEDLSPAFVDRPSGYLRIVKLSQRRGDGAKMALIEFVQRSKSKEEETKVEDKKDEKQKPERKREYSRKT